MKSAASYRVSHVGAKFAVGCSRIHIGSAGPISQRIDLRAGVLCFQFMSGGIALADDQPDAIHDVFSIGEVLTIDSMSNCRQFLLLLGEGHSLEDAVVTAAEAVLLIFRKVCVLLDDIDVCQNHTGDSHDGFSDFFFVEGSSRFNDRMANAVSNQNFHCDFGIILCCICQVNNRTGNTVSYLVRVRRIHFFNHTLILSAPSVGAPSDHPGDLLLNIPWSNSP